jgi:hypothetical protein
MGMTRSRQAAPLLTDLDRNKTNVIAFYELIAPGSGRFVAEEVLDFLLATLGDFLANQGLIAQVFKPPSTLRMTPVMCFAAGLARKATAAATSFGLP